MTGRHQNNAAEWVMWAALWLVVPVVWAAERMRDS